MTGLKCFSTLESSELRLRAARSDRLGIEQTAYRIRKSLTSPRGWKPKPPPCRPFLMGEGIRYLSGSTKVLPTRESFCVTAPQRAQSSRARSTPMEAAETGSKVFDTSIHAQTFDRCVIRAKKESAMDVRPEHSGPTSSLIAPTGSPPRNTSSKDAIPVSATGRNIFGAGVSAEGILCVSAVSI